MTRLCAAAFAAAAVAAAVAVAVSAIGEEEVSLSEHAVKSEIVRVNPPNKTKNLPKTLISTNSPVFLLFDRF